MNEELDIEAAEFVLGTLPAEERAHFAVRLRNDAALRAAVAHWRERLSPLDETATSEAPSAELWQRIDAATAGAVASAGAAASLAAGEPASNVVDLRRRLSRWRGGAIAAGALAAGLAVALVVDRQALPPAPQGGRYVAVVDTGGHEPALIAEVDTNTGLIRVRSVAAETPAGHSLELWHVAEGHAPRSLGVLQAGTDAQTIQDVASAGPVDGVIAVSVEPEGGSPTGAPTGPVVYTGRLIPVE